MKFLLTIVNCLITHTREQRAKATSCGKINTWSSFKPRSFDTFFKHFTEAMQCIQFVARRLNLRLRVMSWMNMWKICIDKANASIDVEAGWWESMCACEECYVHNSHTNSMKLGVLNTWCLQYRTFLINQRRLLTWLWACREQVRKKTICFCFCIRAQCDRVWAHWISSR